MSVGTRDRCVANVGCCESRGGYPFSGVRLNNSCGVELGDRITGRCEVAGVVIQPLPVLLFAVMMLQLNAIGAHTADRVPPETMVDNAFR